MLQCLLGFATCRHNIELFGPEEAHKINPTLKKPKQAQVRAVSSTDNPFAGKGEREKRQCTWAHVCGLLTLDQKKRAMEEPVSR